MCERSFEKLPEEPGTGYQEDRLRTSMKSKTVCFEDTEDLRIGRVRLFKYLKHPERGISYVNYRVKRRKKR